MQRQQVRRNGEEGVALVMALITIVVILLLSTALVTAAITETFSAQTAEDSARALNVAEAGLSHAIALALRADRDWSDQEDATKRECGTITMDGQAWFILQAHGRCLENVDYPRFVPVAVSTPSPSGGSSDAGCASVGVDSVGGGGGGGSGPQPASYGKYTVVFEPLPREEGGADTIRVRAIGKVGRAQRGVEAVLERLTPADFVAYSANHVDSSVRSGSGIMSIHGSVYIRGSWTFKGNAGQYNDRPINFKDATSAPYENQTYVCGDLAMIGSAQIGEPARPMKGAHVAGRGLDNTRIYANRKDKAVPDIWLADVQRVVKCIRGLEDSAINKAKCDSDFGEGMWGAYTNDLQGTLPTRVVWKSQVGSFTREESERDVRIEPLTDAFLLPKRGMVDRCIAAANENLNPNGSLKPGGSRRVVLENCALLYDASAGRLYVAGRQVIYVPGTVVFDRRVTYCVDDEPDGPQQASGDTATMVVACEGCSRDVNSLHVKRDNSAEILARNRGSQNLQFAKTDLLTFLVNGVTRLEGKGTASRDCADPSEQEQDAVFVTGGNPGEIYTKFRLQLFGALIGKSLILQDDPNGPGQAYNVRWCQIPNLRDLVAGTVVGQFLNSGGTSVAIREWREIGFPRATPSPSPTPSP